MSEFAVIVRSADYLRQPDLRKTAISLLARAERPQVDAAARRGFPIPLQAVGTPEQAEHYARFLTLGTGLPVQAARPVPGGRLFLYVLGALALGLLCTGSNGLLGVGIMVGGSVFAANWVTQRNNEYARIARAGDELGPRGHTDPDGDPRALAASRAIGQDPGGDAWTAACLELAQAAVGRNQRTVALRMLLELHDMFPRNEPIIAALRQLAPDIVLDARSPGVDADNPFATGGAGITVARAWDPVVYAFAALIAGPLAMGTLSASAWTNAGRPGRAALMAGIALAIWVTVLAAAVTDVDVAPFAVTGGRLAVAALAIADRGLVERRYPGIPNGNSWVALGLAAGAGATGFMGALIVSFLAGFLQVWLAGGSTSDLQ